MNYDIVEKLKKEILSFKSSTKEEEVGSVVEAGDGIAKVSGLRGALSQEILRIETSKGNVAALAFNLEESSLGVVVLDNPDSVKVGDRVYSTGKVLSLKVGPSLIGRVVDPLGMPLDDKGSLFTDKDEGKDCPLERNAPGVIARESVRVPFHTGIKAIDALFPLGRGQRELIIGDRKTGKTALALDAIMNQKQDTAHAPMICVYVSIGQKNSKVAHIVKLLEDSGAIDYTIIVSAPASSPAPLQYLAPFAGCAIGEYFMDQGKDALVVFDDLSKHADSYRQLSLLLRRPPGREAYPGDIFYLHSRLLERSARLSKKEGGGSLTALPIIETQLGDVSAYVPTNVISITDGQIYLESNLFYKGVRPAVHVGLSVSRVGSAAQTKAMKKVASTLRLDLAQFRELQAFVQFASDLDEGTQKRIKRGELLTELLKQVDGEPIAFERQVVVIYAAINGHMDSVSLEKVKEFETGFLEFLDSLHSDTILDPLRTTGELTEDVENHLKEAIKAFVHHGISAKH